MPKFTVTAPDGQTFDVNAPDGSTQDDAISYVQKNFYQAKAKPAAPVTQDPFKQVAQESSATENLLAGMGGALKGLYIGGKQALWLANQSDVDAHNRAMSGLRSTTSGTIGEVAGNVIPAAATVLIPGANTYTGAAATGAALNALQPIDAGESRIWEGIKGAGLGALGQGVANVAGRLVKPIQATQTPMETELVKKAKDLGIPLSAAQETGSKPLRWIDSALDNLPATAGVQTAKKAEQRTLWQNNLMKQAGADADTATVATMGPLKDKLGQTFNDLSARNTVTLDPQFVQQMSAIQSKNAKAGPLSSGTVDDVASWLYGLGQPKGSPILGANGIPIPVPPSPIDGRLYQEARSILSKKSKDAYSSGNSDLGGHLKDIRNALDDAATRSVSPADSASWNQVRKQYGAMKAIEKSIDPNTGNISPKKFINQLSKDNPNGMLYGKGDQTMPDLARIGKSFVAETLPDSGTAQRSWYMNMLQNPASGIGGALGFLHGGPVGAALGVAAGAATPLAAQKALWGNGRYFREGLLNPETTRKVVRPLATVLPMGLLAEVGK